MATTGIWKVEKRLDHVIDYVINPEKTTRDGDYQELHKLDGYEKLNYETEEVYYLDGYKTDDNNIVYSLTDISNLVVK